MTVRRHTAVAGLGAALAAGSSWRIAAVPVAWQPARTVPFEAMYYIGLALVIGSWLLLGRRLLARERADTSASEVQRFALVSAAPMLLAAPFGRDLWAYAAQGHLVGTGLDPYRHGPADAAGRFADEVSARWLHSPAPYGPIWLRLSQLAAWAAHGHPTIAVLLLRLPAFAGLLLCCWALRVVAHRLGGRADVALWLGAACPLMSVLGVGGGHNDLLMLGLALAGVALACRPGVRNLALAAGVASVGALVKSPAAIAVAFTVPVWLFTRRKQVPARQLATAVAIGSASSLGTVAAVTAASGLGFGWMRQVNSDAQWVSWLSAPSGMTMFGKWATGAAHPRALDDTLRTCRTVGEVVAVIALVALWLLAMSRVARASRTSPIGPLAVALALAALLGPSVQPWYYLWALTVAGLVVPGRCALAWLASVPVMFTVMITPSGMGWESDWRAPLVVVTAGLVTWIVIGRGQDGRNAASGATTRPPSTVRRR